MEYILLSLACATAVFYLSLMAHARVKRRARPASRWSSVSVAFIYVAAFAPAVITVLTPRIGGYEGFLAFDNESGPGAQIARAVGVGTGLGVVAILLLRFQTIRSLPGALSALCVYSAAGILSAFINGHPIGIDLVFAPLAILAVFAASRLPFERALSACRGALRGYVWGSLALALVAPDIAFWSGQNRDWIGLPQLAGLTVHPNGLGSVAALALFAELIRASTNAKISWPNFLAAATVLLATQSRGAWLSALIGLVVYAVSKSGKRWLAVWGGILMGGALVMASLVKDVANSLAGWSSGGDLSTLNGRTTIWEAALDAFSRSPLLGAGPSVFHLDYRSAALGLPDAISAANAHNQIVQTLVERGILGLLALAVLIFCLVRSIGASDRWARSGLAAVLAVYLSRFLVETPLFISTASINGAVLIIVTVMICSSSGRSTPAQSPIPAVRRSLQ